MTDEITDEKTTEANNIISIQEYKENSKVAPEEAPSPLLTLGTYLRGQYLYLNHNEELFVDWDRLKTCVREDSKSQAGIISLAILRARESTIRECMKLCLSHRPRNVAEIEGLLSDDAKKVIEDMNKAEILAAILIRDLLNELLK